MDDLNFNKNELIIMEGTANLDFSLSQIMHEHYMTRASLTTVVKEINLSLKSPVEIEDESHEIFGVTDMPKDKLHSSEARLKRLILKTDSHTA